MSLISFLLSKIKTLKISLTVNHKNALSLFHINTCSLSKIIEELEYLLDKTKIEFHVIGISESGIKSCPTESAVGGTLLYISNNLSYKPRNDLCIYKSTESESTFIEILSPKKTNVIVGCICSHPHMD